jgi:hypothetical protein
MAGVLPTWAGPDEATLRDQSDRLQALQAVQSAAPAVLGGLLSYALRGVTVDARGRFAADLAIDCPGLAAHVRAELSGAVRANPGLALDSVNWLKQNGRTEAIAALAAPQLSPKLLQCLGAEAPQTLDQFLAWLAGRAPELLGEVAQRVMQASGGSVTDMLLVLARKYPRIAARLMGGVVRYCPALLPRLMRLLVQRGPARTP